MKGPNLIGEKIYIRNKRPGNRIECNMTIFKYYLFYVPYDHYLFFVNDPHYVLVYHHSWNA